MGKRMTSAAKRTSSITLGEQGRDPKDRIIDVRAGNADDLAAPRAIRGFYPPRRHPNGPDQLRRHPEGGLHPRGTLRENTEWVEVVGRAGTSSLVPTGTGSLAQRAGSLFPRGGGRQSSGTGVQWIQDA